MSRTAETRAASAGQGTDTTTEAPGSQPADPGLDQIFGVLKNQRRRYVLRYLREHEERTALGTLAEQIAAWENDKRVNEITSTERKRVYVALYQCHLPKMDDVGVVSFNKSRTTVEPGANIALCDPYLGVESKQNDERWPQYYLWLSLAALVGLLGAALIEMLLSIPAIGVTSGLALAALATVSVWYAITESAPEAG